MNQLPTSRKDYDHYSNRIEPHTSNMSDTYPGSTTDETFTSNSDMLDNIIIEGLTLHDHPNDKHT